MNNRRFDAGCSFCEGGFFSGSLNLVDQRAIPASGLEHDPFNHSLGLPSSSIELKSFESVEIWPDAGWSLSESVAVDNLTCTYRANISRYEDLSMQNDPLASLDISDTSAYWHPASMSAHTEGDDATVFERSSCNYNICTPDFVSQHINMTDTDMTHFDDVGSTMSASSTFDDAQWRDKNVNSDSGYGGSIPNNSTASEGRLSSGKRRLNPLRESQTSSNAESDSATTSVGSSRKRRSKSDYIGRRLVCPFYIRDQTRCKSKACGGKGYASMSELKNHLRQAHLYFRCDRCQISFQGKKGAEELRCHLQMPSGCALRPRCELWGIDEETLGKIKSCKGMTPGARWHHLYGLLFQTDATSELPDPCEYYGLDNDDLLTSIISDVKPEDRDDILAISSTPNRQ